MTPLTRVLFCAVTLLMLLTLVGACSQISLPKLKFAVAKDGASHAIASGIADLARKRGIADIELVLLTDQIEEPYHLLLDGRADLGLVQNSNETNSRIAALIPVFTSVLHVFYRLQRDEATGREIPFKDLVTLFEGKKVYAEGPGSLARKLLSQGADIMQLDMSSIEFVPYARLFEADVMIVIAPISPQIIMGRLSERLNDFRLATLVSHPDTDSAGSVQYITPQLQPVMIPPNAYGPLNPNAIITLGVSTLLAGRSVLNSELVHDLVKMVAEEHAELAKSHAALFNGVKSDFSAAALNFKVHQGALDYINRDSPDVFERYAELWTLVITLLLATLSGVVAFVRWRKQAKKDRIDLYYQELLVIRDRIPVSSADERAKMLVSVKQIEARAYQQLINEQLLANESFSIFLMMCSSTMDDLSQP